jgi:hypothetical protein
MQEELMLEKINQAITQELLPYFISQLILRIIQRKDSTQGVATRIIN